MNIISFSNFGNGSQFPGENTDPSPDKEIGNAEFSALLSAFCAGPQIPLAAAPLPSENLSEQFTLKTVDTNEIALPKLVNPENLQIVLPTGEKSLETVEFRSTENHMELPVEKKSDFLIDESFFPSDNVVKAADDLNKEIEKTKTFGTGFSSKKFEVGTGVEKIVFENSFNNHLVEITTPLQFKNENSVLPAQPNQLNFVSSVSSENLPKQIEAQPQIASINLQQIFQTIAELTNKNFSSTNLNIQNLSEPHLADQNSVEQIIRSPIETGLVQENLVQQNLQQQKALPQNIVGQILISNYLADQSPVGHNSAQEKLVQLDLIQHEQNLVQQSSFGENLIQQNLATQNVSRQNFAQILNESPESVIAKPATKVDESSFIEALANAGIALDQQQNLNVEKQTPKITENSQINSFDQVSAAILELTDKINSVREPQIFKLRLRPAELGTVEIKLEQIETGKLTARLITQSESTRQIFTENISQLREALTEAGWKIENIEISCDSFQNTAGFSSGDNQPPPTPTEERRLFASDNDRSSEVERILTETYPPQSNRLLSVRA